MQQVLELGVLFHPACRIGAGRDDFPALLARRRERGAGQLASNTATAQLGRNASVGDGTTMKKSGSAVWMGDLKTGQGTISTETGVLRDAPYGFKARFEDGPGTNPEELIGAAHAACFSMALSLMLGEKNLTAKKISTKADVTLEKLDDGFTITAVHLTLSASIPGTDNATFQSIAAQAKTGCPVSKLLNAKITLDATLDA